MGIDAMVIGVHFRKSLIFSIRTCYRSAHSHPFLVGILFLIFLLYRFLPSVFGFLLSSSPVLVCTFVLLGTLLSFGHPNIPEIIEEEEVEEEEENKKTHHDISSLKAEFVEGDFVVQRDESFSVETHVENNKEIEQTALDEKDLTFPTTSLGDGFITGRSIEATTLLGDDGLISGRSIVLEKEPKEIHGQVFEEKRDYYSPKFIEKREFYDLEFAQNREFSEVKPLMEVGINDEEVENVETDNPAGEPQSTNLGHLFGSAQDSSSWKEIGDNDESYDSGSDGAESSSPDASMTDIIPMLDELHPLLDVEHPQAALISLDDDSDSDAASERSHRSSDENVDSGDEEDVENHEDYEEEEEERQHGVQGDEDEAVVTWTEDDEKNLMDLGNSELERNRRLESLIARRRARKSFRMMEAEKNMIDFDSIDLPFQIAPISTARRNPFDLHYDSNMGIGLPPIPGSAPSVLLPSRNPFDLPYDPHEERPNLSGGSFTEEVTSALGKDYFKRHESFHLGASYFAQERHDTKFRPYFVPEKMASGSMGYSAFQRQMSEISDSKLSSATETESVSSLANQDHKNIVEQESFPGELVSLVNHTPDHGIEENQYSEGVDFDQEDKRDPELSQFESKYEENENSPGAHSSMQYTQFITSPMEPTTSDVHMNPQVVEKQHTRSSSSSSSEEKIFDVNIEEELAHLETPRGDSMEYSRSFLQPQVVDSALNSRVREGIDDRQTEEPVYDVSPSATQKDLSGMTNIVEALSAIIDRRVLTSTSSIESDMQVEVSEVDSTSASVEGNISLTDAESSLHNGSIKNEMSSGDERMWVASPEVSVVDDNEPTSVELPKISEPRVLGIEFSDVNHNSDDLVAPMPPSVVEKVMSYLNSSSSDTESEEEKSLSEEANLPFKLDQVSQSTFNPHIHDGIHQSDVDDKVDPMASSCSDGESSSSLPSIVSEKQLPSLEMEKIIVQQSSDGECEESQEISTPSEMSTKETGVIDNVDDPIVEDYSNPQSTSESAEMSTKESGVIANVDEPKVEDFSNLSQSASESAYLVSEVPKNYPIQLDFDNYRDEIQSDSKLHNLELYEETIGSHVSEEEFDEESEEIKDIDDRLLSELDAVGDFSFEELKTSSDQVVEVHDSLTGLQVIEVASDEDIEDVSDKSLKHEASEGSDKPRELELRTDDVVVEDRSLGMKSTFKDEVPEASSANIIDSSLNHEEPEESIAVEPLHDEFLLKVAEDEHPEIAVSGLEPNLMETGLELPVLEARSRENHDSTLKQLDEREMENSVLESIHEESVPGETEVGVAVIESLIQDQSPTETNLELPVVEARSLEEIKSAFKKLGEQEADELVLEKPESESAVPNHGQISTGTSLELPVVEAASLEDIDSAFKQFGKQEAVETNVLEAVHNEMTLEKSAVGSAELEVPNQKPVLTETSSDLPVVEATSLEDIHSAFRQFGELEADETNVLEAVHNEMTSRETSVGSAEFEVPNQNQVLTETSSDLPVVEATSLEDTAFRQFGELEADETNVLEAAHKESMLKETEVDSAVYEVPNQDQTPTETSLDLPVVEATSLEDIDFAFKQLGETDFKSVDHEPVHKESIIVEPEAGSSVFEAPNQDQIPTGTSLEFPINEARSLEGIDSDFKQLHEGEDEDSAVLEPIHVEPILEETEVEESVMEQNLVGSTVPCNEDHNPTETSLEELPILEARSVEDIDSAFKRLREGESENSNVEAVYDESVPNETEVETSVIPNQDENPREASSEQLPVLEARSVEDIDSALKQHFKAKDENSIVLEAVHGESALEETQVGHAALPIQEVQDQVPVDAIESITNQLGEGEFESPSIHETFQIDSKLDEPETQSANSREEPRKSDFDLVVPVLEERSLQGDNSSFVHLGEGGGDDKPIHELVGNKPRVLDSLDSCSDLQVHEERSVVDTHSPAEKLSEGKVEDLLKPTGSEDSSAEDLVKDRESSEVRFEEFVKQETGRSFDEESQHGYKETHGDSSLSKTSLEKKNKEKGSDNSSSSSSSSDSD